MQKEKAWSAKYTQEAEPVRKQADTGKIAVQLDHKTVVLVKPGTDVEALRKRYQG